ncbi:hypothetical protein JVU11DRAFT_1319 [Chiua virens]|nr:hypothetical protein JVU11DRAFT_1319 [Chiua virens]
MLFICEGICHGAAPPASASRLPITAEETNDDRQKFPSDNSRLVITNMRLESFNVDHVDSGVCVLVHFGPTTRRTVNKPYAKIIEWDDEIMLPSDLPVYVTVCGVFQLGSTLGTREISAKQAINTGELSGSTYNVIFGLLTDMVCRKIQYLSKRLLSDSRLSTLITKTADKNYSNTGIVRKNHSKSLLITSKLL